MGNEVMGGNALGDSSPIHISDDLSDWWDPTKSDTWKNFLDPGNVFGWNNRTPQPTESDILSARITREQWQHFLDTYRPVEEQALNRAMQTDFSAEGDEAGSLATAAASASKGMLARNASRSGTTFSAEDKKALDRRQSLSLTKSVSRAENTTRRGMAESRSQLLSNIVGIGRGVAATASAGAQSVADMAAARQMQGLQQRTQQTQSNMQAGATAASLLLTFV